MMGNGQIDNRQIQMSILYIDVAVDINPDTFNCNKENKLGWFAIEFRIYFVR